MSNFNGKVLSYIMRYFKGSISHIYVEKALINDPNYEIHIVRNKDILDDALAVYRKKLPL